MYLYILEGNSSVLEIEHSIPYPWKLNEKYPISLEAKWQISCIPRTHIQASKKDAQVAFITAPDTQYRILVDSSRCVRKPICDIVFCVMSFIFRCFDFLLSYFEFLVYLFCVRCCSF